MSNDELIKRLRANVPERGEWTTNAQHYCGLAADVIEQQASTIYHLEKAVQEWMATANGLTAARIAYASEFAPNADGEPDVGNIHANIRAMKAELFEAGDEVEKLERALADCRDACGEIARMDDDLLMCAVSDPFSVPAFVAEAIRLLNADNAALMEDAAAQIQIAREATERAAGLEVPTLEMIQAGLAVRWPALYRDCLYGEHDGIHLRAETETRINMMRQQYLAMVGAAVSHKED